MKTVKKVVVTGGLGNLGRVMVPALLGSEYELWLVVRKNRSGASASQRVKEVFGQEIASRVQVVETDLLDLGSVQLGFRPDLVFHSAGSVKFENPSALDTNYQGVKAVVKLAENNGFPKVVFVSTAYVLGNGASLAESVKPCSEILQAYEVLRSRGIGDFQPLISELGSFGVYGQARNFYELSKQLYELVVADLLQKAEWQGKAFIFRPSIITNSGHDGYHGYHGLVFLMRKWLEYQWEFNSKRLEEAGIFFRDGSFHLPITLKLSTTSRLNLIPADWTVRVMIGLCEKILSEEASQTVFNVTHPNPPSMLNVVARSLPEMGILGARVGELTDPGNPLLTFIQDTIGSFLGPFYAYVLGEGRFETGNCRAILRDSFSEPCEITKEVLASWTHGASGLLGNYGYSETKIQKGLEMLDLMAGQKLGW